METILIQTLKFVGASAASGITWDAIKGAGSRILDGFKKHFANRKYFKDERQGYRSSIKRSCIRRLTHCPAGWLLNGGGGKGFRKRSKVLCL